MRLQSVAAAQADVEVVDDDGVDHRLWPISADGDGPMAQVVADLLATASASTITIADGHHRYETALRYRDERRMSRSCEEDPAFDYLLVLMLESGQPLTVLPTHRLVRGIDPDRASTLVDATRRLFDVEPVGSSERLVSAFSPSAEAGGRGRIGLWTRDGGAILTARPGAMTSSLPAGGHALRSLDVTILGTALHELLDIDDDAVAAGAIEYTKSAADAVASVDADNGIDAAFLLEATPVASIEAVARDGDVMPQKSTYFYPKALTGLVINPHEW
jgi:uncharacterized protein (DUF1015 family)